MSKRKVIMLTDSSLTYPKVMSPDAQAVLKRLEAYGAEIVYVQDRKDLGPFPCLWSMRPRWKRQGRSPLK